MNGRTQAENGLHDSLVRMLAKHFRSLGYTGIRADIPDYPQTPDGIHWNKNPERKYIPDITCYKNNDKKTFIIAEIETPTTLNLGHTEEQWKIFAAQAKVKGGEFHVMTPKESISEAQAFAEKMGLEISQYWLAPE